MRTPSCFAQKSRRVAFIDHYYGIILFGQLNNFIELGDSTIHAERTIRYDNSATEGTGFLQFGFEVLHIIMLIPETLSLAQTDTVYNGCMVERVRNDGIFLIE